MTVVARRRLVHRVAVIVVNYQGWSDTLACVASLLTGSCVPAHVVVVDNASPNDSWRELNQHLGAAQTDAATFVETWLPTPNFASVQPAWPIVLNAPRIVAELRDDCLALTPSTAVQITLLASPTNGGFGAGNNVAMRALTQSHFEGHFWLVNGDALVAPDCLATIVAAIDAGQVGALAGTVLVEMHDVHQVQACGAQLSRPWLSPRAQDAGQQLSAVQARGDCILADYPVGASLLLATSARATWDERLFLYYEEAMMARALNMARVPILTRAVVAHAGAGSTDGAARYSSLRDRHATRSRALLAGEMGVVNVVAVACFALALAAKRTLTQGARAGWVVLKGWAEAWSIQRAP